MNLNLGMFTRERYLHPRSPNLLFPEFNIKYPTEVIWGSPNLPTSYWASRDCSIDSVLNNFGCTTVEIGDFISLLHEEVLKFHIIYSIPRYWNLRIVFLEGRINMMDVYVHKYYYNKYENYKISLAHNILEI